MLDLQKFCGTDWYRPYLHKPFSAEGFTWATNGHVIVRVDAIDGIEPLPKNQSVNVAATLKGLDTAKFFSPSFNLPPEELSSDITCPACEGRGKEHDCPDCECVCDDCNGKGRVTDEPRTSTTIGGVHFTLRYIHLISSLPGLQISHTAKADGFENKPMIFRFDGGVGALMPRTSKAGRHIEIEQAAA